MLVRMHIRSTQPGRPSAGKRKLRRKQTHLAMHD